MPSCGITSVSRHPTSHLPTCSTSILKKETSSPSCRLHCWTGRWAERHPFSSWNSNVALTWGRMWGFIMVKVEIRYLLMVGWEESIKGNGILCEQKQKQKYPHYKKQYHLELFELIQAALFSQWPLILEALVTVNSSPYLSARRTGREVALPKINDAFLIRVRCLQLTSVLPQALCPSPTFPDTDLLFATIDCLHFLEFYVN